MVLARALAPSRASILSSATLRLPISSWTRHHLPNASSSSPKSARPASHRRFSFFFSSEGGNRDRLINALRELPAAQRQAAESTGPDERLAARERLAHIEQIIAASSSLQRRNAMVALQGELSGLGGGVLDEGDVDWSAGADVGHGEGGGSDAVGSSSGEATVGSAAEDATLSNTLENATVSSASDDATLGNASVDAFLESASEDATADSRDQPVESTGPGFSYQPVETEDPAGSHLADHQRETQEAQNTSTILPSIDDFGDASSVSAMGTTPTSAGDTSPSIETWLVDDTSLEDKYQPTERISRPKSNKWKVLPAAGLNGAGSASIVVSCPGTTRRLNKVWLRNRCTCSACVDDVTGLRKFSLLDVPEHLSTSTAQFNETNGDLEVDVSTSFYKPVNLSGVSKRPN